MTDATICPHYPFDNEARRAAFEQLGWEAAGLAIRARTQAFFAHVPANPVAHWEPRACPNGDVDGLDWVDAGRAAREHTQAFFARRSSFGTC